MPRVRRPLVENLLHSLSSTSDYSVYWVAFQAVRSICPVLAMSSVPRLGLGTRTLDTISWIFRIDLKLEIQIFSSLYYLLIFPRKATFYYVDWGIGISSTLKLPPQVRLRLIFLFNVMTKLELPFDFLWKQNRAAFLLIKVDISQA